MLVRAVAFTSKACFDSPVRADFVSGPEPLFVFSVRVLIGALALSSWVNAFVVLPSLQAATIAAVK